MEEKQARVKEFAAELLQKQRTGEISRTILATSDRVLARITDGIYRQPSSALRELISNAYDADATEVVIETDAPKFETIKISDNGNGMTREALSNLIHNIGGSLKRTATENTFGVVDTEDPTLSPTLKRKLIGKIGIGLFAVSQLTHHFQIITKRKGDNFRLVADVILKTYTEDELAALKTKKTHNFETGTVEVKSVPDPNKNAHGTDIILLRLKKNAQDMLRSKERWLRVLAPENSEDEGVENEPDYHIGKVSIQDGSIIERSARLPWGRNDTAAKKFHKLTQVVLDKVGVEHPNPKLAHIFDNYLNTIWTLSLAAPLPYVEKHPFDIHKDDDIRAFLLSNDRKGQAEEIKFTHSRTVREIVGLETPQRPEGDTFNVLFDGVLLKRPIMFSRLPSTANAIKRPLLFVGKCAPNLSKVPEEIRGGKLSFEAYLFWNSKIVPSEHNGILLRIHDASGALFDATFLKYQTSEQVRLRQLTAEIFVKEGLDAALNIDRESFNFAHPHYLILTQWLHRAIRQFANKHKAIGSEVRDDARTQEHVRQMTRTVQIADTEWKKHKKSEAVPKIVLLSDRDTVKAERSKGKIAFSKESIIPETAHQRGNAQVQANREQKVESLVTILEAHDVLADMSYAKQEELIRAIVDLFLGE